MHILLLYFRSLFKSNLIRPLIWRNELVSDWMQMMVRKGRGEEGTNLFSFISSFAWEPRSTWREKNRQEKEVLSILMSADPTCQLKVCLLIGRNWESFKGRTLASDLSTFFSLYFLPGRPNIILINKKKILSCFNLILFFGNFLNFRLPWVFNLPLPLRTIDSFLQY